MISFFYKSIKEQCHLRLHNHIIIACLSWQLSSRLPTLKSLSSSQPMHSHLGLPSVTSYIKGEYKRSYTDECFDIRRHPRAEQRHSIVRFNWYLEFKRHSGTLGFHFFHFPHFSTRHHSATSAGALWVLSFPSKYTSGLATDFMVYNCRADPVPTHFFPYHLACHSHPRCHYLRLQMLQSPADRGSLLSSLSIWTGLNCHVHAILVMSIFALEPTVDLWLLTALTSDSNAYVWQFSLL